MMPSVSSLDRDLAQSRKSRYTPQAAGEVVSWIQEVLRDQCPPKELMDVLKDGVILCELANKLDSSKQIRFKKSAMPFVQMENISHFLSFVAKPPVSLPPHDLFLTVDLYEKKDPAQVVQCLTSFSRIAHRLNPTAFPSTVGHVKGALSPSHTGGSSVGGGVRRAASEVSGGAPPLPGRKPTVSTWSSRSDEGKTLPAWNIAQYGYMGGASQGNQGISFGGRRQITGTPVHTGRPKTPTPTTTPTTPTPITPGRGSFLDRERVARRQEEDVKKAEEERVRKETEEQARKQLEQEALEREIQEAADKAARLRVEEDEKAAAQQAAAQEEEERQAIARERQKWKEEDQKRQLWKQEQDRARELERAKEEEAKARPADRSAEHDRIKQLEAELAAAKEREHKFQVELEERRQREKENVQPKSADEEERRFLQGAWKAEKETHQQQPQQPPQTPPRLPNKPLRIFQRTPGGRSPPKPPPRTLPTPPNGSASPGRHLGTRSIDLGRSDSTVSWMAGDDTKPLDSPAREKKDFKWARMSLLERERERERERQREWEQSQQETQQLAEKGVNDGEGWDVNQYGYLGGADQGKMGVAFGARRQIIGPRSQGQ